MDRGRLSQEGTHWELIKRDGPYRRLWEKQHGFELDQSCHRAMITLERLAQLPVFYGFPEDLLADAVPLFRTHETPEDRLILRQDDPGTCLYVIVAGRVSLVHIEPDGCESARVILEEGDCFREAAQLDTTEPNYAYSPQKLRSGQSAVT